MRKIAINALITDYWDLDWFGPNLYKYNITDVLNLA